MAEKELSHKEGSSSADMNYGRDDAHADPQSEFKGARGGSEVSGAHSVSAHNYGRGQAAADESVAYPINEIGHDTGSPKGNAPDVTEALLGRIVGSSQFNNQS